MQLNIASRPRLSLPCLSRLFSLSPLEQECLLVCLAPEIDRKYEKLYAYLNDDVTRKRPTVDLVLRLCCQSADEQLAGREIFHPQSPLIRCRLLQVQDQTGDGTCGSSSPSILPRPTNRRQVWCCI